MENEIQKPRKKRGTKPGAKIKKSAQGKINDTVFDTAIKIPLNANDFAACFGVSPDTLDRYCKARFGKTFAAISFENKGMFKRNIIGKQYEMAMRGNTPMLKWLGQNYAEQTEKIEQKQTITIEPEIEYKTKWGGVGEPTEALPEPIDNDDGG